MSTKVIQDKDPDIELFVKVRQSCVEYGVLIKDRDTGFLVKCPQYVLVSSRNPIGEMWFHWQVDPGSV